MTPGLCVSRETDPALEEYRQLLIKWNQKINLVSESTLPDFWTRHALDGQQIAYFLKDKSNWIDMGSGAGFPAIPAFIKTKEQGKEVRLTMADSDQRKCAFLRSCCRILSLDAEVVSIRVEDIQEKTYDFASARALAPLTQLLTWSHKILHPHGQLLSLKGRTWKSELDHASNSWKFDCEVVKSKSDSEAVVLKLVNLERR